MNIEKDLKAKLESAYFFVLKYSKITVWEVYVITGFFYIYLFHKSLTLSNFKFHALRQSSGYIYLGKIAVLTLINDYIPDLCKSMSKVQGISIYSKFCKTAVADLRMKHNFGFWRSQMNWVMSTELMESKKNISKCTGIHLLAFILAFSSRKKDNTKFVTLHNSKIFRRTKTVHIFSTVYSSFVVCKKVKICTSKSFSEALILASVDPQYDERLSIELQEKKTGSEQVV